MKINFRKIWGTSVGYKSGMKKRYGFSSLKIQISSSCVGAVTYDVREGIIIRTYYDEWSHGECRL